MLERRVADCYTPRSHRAIQALYLAAKFAFNAIVRTRVIAGSRRLLSRPASSLERDGHVLTWRVIGRWGIGVGSQLARL